MGLGRGLRPPEFEAFGVDQEQWSTRSRAASSHPPGSGRRRAARGSQLVLWSPPRRVSSIAAGSFLLCIRYSSGDNPIRPATAGRDAVAERYVVGVDLGQSADPTAVCVMSRCERPGRRTRPSRRWRDHRGKRRTLVTPPRRGGSQSIVGCGDAAAAARRPIPCWLAICPELLPPSTRGARPASVVTW